MLLSPATSRRLSGSVPALGRSGSRSSFGRQGSASRPRGASESTAHEVPGAASSPAADETPQTPISEAFPTDVQSPDASDGAVNVQNSVVAAGEPVAVDEPARQSKRRRLSSRTTKVAATPVQHQEVIAKMSLIAAPADKLFDNDMVTMERMQSVQCDRCGKWRLVDPDLQVRAHSAVRGV